MFAVSTSGDAQGLSLAVDSAKTNTCWYAFDVESTPAGPPLATASDHHVRQRRHLLREGRRDPAGGCVALNPDTDANITFCGQHRAELQQRRYRQLTNQGSHARLDVSAECKNEKTGPRVSGARSFFALFSRLSSPRVHHPN